MRNQEGVNISMKKTALLFSVVLVFFLVLGVASATEIDNVTSTEDVNLTTDTNELSLADSDASDLESILKANTEVFNEEQDSVLESGSDENLLAAAGNSSSDDNSTNITPTKTQLTVFDAHYNKANTVFKVGLTDSLGNGIAGKQISLKINSKTYKAKTDSQGFARISTPSFNIGTYTATYTFAGDEEYIKSSVKQKVKVIHSISGRTNPKSTYGSKISYSAIFWKDTSRYANSNVKFIVNGKTYTVKTDSTGKATTSFSLNPGTYKIRCYNPYSKENTYNTITVNKQKIVINASNAYLLPKVKYKYHMTVSKSNGAALKNCKVVYTFNNKKVTTKTDGDGIVQINIPALAKGTYKISLQYQGNYRYKAASASANLYVKDSTTVLKASPLKMQYNDGSQFSVKVTNTAGKALTNKNLKVNIDDKKTTLKTDSNGVAKLPVGDLKPGTYKLKAVYSTAGLKDYNYLTSTVTISKQTVTISASDLVMEHDNLKNYVVTIKNKTGSPIEAVKVNLNLNSKNYVVTTAEDGTTTLAVNEAIGYYPVTVQLATNANYTSSKVTKHILVNGTKFSASDMTIVSNTATKFSVKLLDGQDKPVNGKTIKFTLNNKVTSVQTDANGIASIDVPGLSKGTYTVTYTDGKITGSSKITVADKVTLKQIITASQNLKKYIESNEKLLTTVNVGTTTVTLAQYLYLASQAIIELDSGKNNDIGIKTVTNPTSPKEAANLGYLYDYVTVAKNLVNTINSKGSMPNSVSSSVGTIGYDGLVYAFARVVAYYGDNSFMPNYVTIKPYETSMASSLNSKNTIKDLKPYKVATTNCQVGNAKIKAIVESVTSGLTTDKAKATAIYNYVRDKVSYSFYYDTKYGAVGTLNAKVGNCVDQAHLLIAMYRTAGLAARYAHGTCVFSDGTYGHVWTQVLIGDTWVVGDPTSTRNSFGNVISWNNYNYQLKGYYSGISF